MRRHERRGWHWRMVVDASTTILASAWARSVRRIRSPGARRRSIVRHDTPETTSPVHALPIESTLSAQQRFRPGRRSGYVDPDWDPAADFDIATDVENPRTVPYTELTGPPWRQGILALLMIGVFAVGTAIAVQPDLVPQRTMYIEPTTVVQLPVIAAGDRSVETRPLGPSHRELNARVMATVVAQQAAPVVHKVELINALNTPVPPTPVLRKPVAARSQPIELQVKSEREAFARAGGLPERAMSALPFRGMGYQPTYVFAGVPRADRKVRLELDFRRMSDVGINLVNGWDDGIFDDLLLDVAAANHMFVIMPLDVPKGRDYSDPEVRSLTKAYVSERVMRYRDRDPILMWGPGVEVTLQMTPDQERVFAQFMLELYDTIRALDPTRPVIIREAEDVFAPHVTDAIARRQGINLSSARVVSDGDDEAPAPRTVVRAPVGLVYGVHFYTERMGPALTDWIENQGLDIPLMVTEYAPAGIGRALRAEGFEQMYRLIQSGGPRVLGSTPYTWSTDGPEAVDRYFGLVDPEGRPIDAALETITALYGVDPPAWVRDAQEDHDIALASEVPKLLDEAVVVAARRSEMTELQIRASAASRIPLIYVEIGITEADMDPGAARTREVVALIGFAHILSEQWEANGTRRMFPGMYEALPLLSGMARWSRGEPSATDTARGFMASVLRRDLDVLIAS